VYLTARPGLFPQMQFPITRLLVREDNLLESPEAIGRGILPARGGIMLQQMNQTEARDLERSCQAVSPMDEPCDSTATFHCGLCGRWFCPAHAQDESWHTCVLEPADEGGEA